jgi:uncharacterized protein YjdB
MGTPTYMSPEQCVGGEITGASDQYSLGIVAYQMLSGCLPFDADTVMSTMWAHVNEPPAPILDVRPDCPPTMATAIMRMLAKDPALRWPTVADAVSVIGTAAPDAGEKARVEMQALAMGTLAETRTTSGGAKRPAGRGGPATARVDRPEEPVALVTVQPPAGKITVGETLKLNGLTKAANGAPLSRRRVAWMSSAPTVAAVSSDGIVTGVSEGTATITAACERAVDVATIRVTPVPIAAVKVRPGRGALKVTESLQLEVELADAQGVEVAPRPVRWASSDPSVVSVSRDGLVQGISPGSVLIAATLDGKRGVAQITVTPIPLAALLVTPRDPIIGIGESIQLHANPVDERGMTLPDRAVTWSTSNPDVVAVSERGVVLGRALGTAKVTAQCEEKIVTLNVSARPVPIAHLVVETSGGTMVVEERVQLHAEPQDASGRLLADRPVTWTSSDPNVIDITPAGVAHARSAGTVKITASCEGHEATITAMVTRVGVASVELNSPVRNLEVGMETELHVITQDRFGQPLRKRFVQWASSNPNVVRVTPSGRVVALAPGAAQISAACGSYSDSVSITVTPPRVAHLKIEPSRCSIPEGWQKQFRAVVLSPTGEAISDVQCEWMVSDPTVATVSPEGVVTTHRPGSVMVAASADGKRATSRILVTVAG